MQFLIKSPHLSSEIVSLTRAAVSGSSPLYPFYTLWLAFINDFVHSFIKYLLSSALCQAPL